MVRLPGGARNPADHTFLGAGPSADAALPTHQDYYQLALEVRDWNWTRFPLRHDKTPGVGWRRYQDRRPSDRDITRMFARWWAGRTGRWWVGAAVGLLTAATVSVG